MGLILGLLYVGKSEDISFIDILKNYIIGMQAQNPCMVHEGQSNTRVCLSKDCELPRMFCDLCIDNHKKHQIIAYKQFQKKYYEFQQIYTVRSDKIKKAFKTVQETFSLCIRRAQERILKQFLPCSTVVGIPKLDQIQSQQLYGVVYTVANDEKFRQIGLSGYSVSKFEDQIDKNLNYLMTYIQELNTTNMAAINKLTSQIILTKVNTDKLAKPQQNQMPQQFKFSQKYKAPILSISEDGECISRKTTAADGLTMYAVLDQPLTKERNIVAFRIVKQDRRFMYFGVCDRDTFKAFNFNGALYQKGNKMYAIRQGRHKANAVTLHNSREDFSNVDKVPFDIDVGDTISIKYDKAANNITFTKNYKQTFEMPLDEATTEFYPFVGLKFNNDSVRVLKLDQSKQQYKNKVMSLLLGFR